jgi:hypothetical protein
MRQAQFSIFFWGVSRETGMPHALHKGNEEVVMKYVWESEPRKSKLSYQLWGLYRKEGWLRRRLICYFLSQNDAVECAKCLGRGFMTARMRRSLKFARRGTIFSPDV